MTDFTKAFISHAHEDKSVALALAIALREGGVEAWIDAWEIAPGDSLVDKIFEQGLKDCGVFLVLLSPASLASRWVKDELDAAVVRRIAGQTRTISVRVAPCEVPEALRAYRWLDLSIGLEKVAREIVDAAYGRSVAPPVVAPKVAPTVATGGLSPNATQVGLVLAPGLGAHRYLRGAQLVAQTGMSPDSVNDAVEELEEHGAVKVHRAIGTSPYRFSHVVATPELAHLLKEKLDYDPAQDVAVVAAALVARGTLDGPALARETGLSPERVNSAVDFLETRRLAEVLRAIGTGPYSFVQAAANSSTRRLVASRAG